MSIFLRILRYLPDPIARKLLPRISYLLRRYEKICRYHYDLSLSPLWWELLKETRVCSESVAQRLDYMEINT